ncbi:hypothetical protein [Thioalkalivibrio versutus]|uniref:hypothetical protein n=1 Tax=Thioalkalivibrio versutus TaxID=106634 RepID=UPI0003785749|nr:hypothetical protein [Thioalkalivibrio versutus]OOC49737.1 hypothetical protein B0684_04275 [Thioalkalivibrio versutus]
MFQSSNTRRSGRILALPLLLSAMASGCALLPVEQDAPAPTGDRPASEPAAPETDTTPPEGTDNQPETDTNTDTAAGTDTDTETETETRSTEPTEPSLGLHIARSSSAESERRVFLREQGHETLDPGRLGYYMDVLGARLRQELSGQPSAIDHQDSGIRVTLPEGADQARALDTIGRLLDEFGASLVTVIAHGHGMDASDTSSEGTEDDAMAAGRRLENAGVAPERLVLRVFGTTTPAGNLGSEAFSPQIELLIQPLAAS